MSLLLALATSAPLLHAPAPPPPVQDEAAPAIRESLNLDRRGVAMKGYDPVSYRPEGGSKPAKGKEEHTVVYRGATYRFVDETNRDRFVERPSHYAPVYGGWCAYAMASDDRVEVDPRSYRIEQDGLLLFYDGLFADTRRSWGREDTEALRGRADGHWDTYSGEPRLPLSDTFPEGVALGGHDPTAYFGDGGAAVPGDARLHVEYRGRTYRFANGANRARFLADPDRYEPAFGGWGVVALASGERVVADPARFAITSDGRLVVFAPLAEGAEDPLARWEREGAATLAAAQRSWDTIQREAAEALERAAGR